MKRALLLVIILLPFFILGQNIKKSITGDFLLQKTVKESKLPLTLRLYNERQFLDIAVSADSAVSGSITNFTWPCPNRDCIIADISQAKMYSQEITLSPKEANAALFLIRKYTILEMPSSEQIEGWIELLDGGVLNIEQNINGSYNFKSYDAPPIPSEVIEAVQLSAFYKELNSCLRLDERHSTFLHTIGSGTYINGDILITIRKKHWWKFWMW
jgi:hypothetical protein